MAIAPETRTARIKAHIEKYFGPFSSLMVDTTFPEYPIEIVVIEPRVEHDYLTLVTVGLSQREMTPPEPEEVEDEDGDIDFAIDNDEEYRRCELVINLPRDWLLTPEALKDPKWRWPITEMLNVAHAPLKDPTAFVDSDDLFWDEDIPGAPSGMHGMLLLYPAVFGEASFFCRVTQREMVSFFQLIALYKEEVDLMGEEGLDALIDVTSDDEFEVIVPNRPNAVTEPQLVFSDACEIDHVRYHWRRIEAAGSKIDPREGLNPLAFFLGWAMERDRLSLPFIAQHRDVIEAYKKGELTDLRDFIANELNSAILINVFDSFGAEFACWYDQNDRSNPYIFVRDLRQIAIKTCGLTHFDSVQEEAAAYLRLPVCRETQKAVNQIIDKRYKRFLQLEDPVGPQLVTVKHGPSPIADWSGPGLCWSSERIAEDGCRAAFMRRRSVKRENEAWESGWLIAAWDEVETYGEENYPLHCGFYDIREIAAIDPSIVPYLELPPGTCLARQPDGDWQVVEEVDGKVECIEAS